MDNVPQKPAPAAAGWRQAATVGAAVGIALPVSRGVAAALEPVLGSGWAFVLGLVAAGVAGAGVGLVACCLFRPARAEQA